VAFTRYFGDRVKREELDVLHITRWIDVVVVAFLMFGQTVGPIHARDIPSIE
jgi:hypothetical protein